MVKWTLGLVGQFRNPHLLIVTRDVFRVASRYWADGKLINLENAKSFEQCMEAAEGVVVGGSGCHQVRVPQDGLFV